MFNFENLMEHVAEIINTQVKGTVTFTYFDMLYVYGQTELHTESAKLRHFHFMEGRATGTYASNTGYYELTIMTPEFQKFMKKFLQDKSNTFAFTDEILIVTKQRSPSSNTG